MVAFNKIEIFVEDLAEGVHDLATDQLTIALTTNANMPVTTNNILGDLTPIAYTNLAGDRNIAVPTSSVHTTGTYKIILVDKVFTATGTVADFAGVAIYNLDTVGKVDPLICWYNHGSTVSLANGETFTVDFDVSNGWLTIA